MAFRRWIWVRDTTTNHHMDVDERQLERLVRTGAVEPVPNYPVNEGQNVSPRRAKPNVNLGAEQNNESSGSTPETSASETAGTPPSTSASPRRGSTRTAPAAPTADTTSAEGADK